MKLSAHFFARLGLSAHFLARLGLIDHGKGRSLEARGHKTKTVAKQITTIRAIATTATVTVTAIATVRTRRGVA